MKKSRIFNILPKALVALGLIFSSSLSAQSGDGVEVLPLYPESSTQLEATVSGTFTLDIYWQGESMNIESILWNNEADNNGSAFLKILNGNGIELWSGYPQELADNNHSFVISEVVFEENAQYTLEFDITQMDVSIYSNDVFPWRPTGDDGPVEIISANLTGAIEQPIDPDKIFPYFTMNMVRGIGVEEESSLVDYSPSPNPAIDWISLPELTSTATVEIYNLNGQRVFQSTIEPGQERLNIDELSTGMYILRITGENQEVSNSRIVVE